jgi:hypothetical protein
MGMEGKNTLILWSSSEVFQEGLMGDMGFLQMAEVREFVKQTVFMKGDQTKVTVPAGIFKDADMAMFSMYGYGPGAALDKAQPLPRIRSPRFEFLIKSPRLAGWDQRVMRIMEYQHCGLQFTVSAPGG